MLSDTESVEVLSLEEPTPLSQCLESPRLSLSRSSDSSPALDQSEVSTEVTWTNQR